MSWVDAVSWLTISSLGAGLATLVLIKLLYEYRGKPGANWLLVLSAVQAGFCFSYGLSLVVFDPALRVWFESATWIGMAWTGPLFLAFALEYTGRGNIVRSALYAPIVGVTLLSSGLALTPPLRGLLWTDFEILPSFGSSTVQYTFEPLGYLTVLTVLVTAGIGLLLLLEAILSYGPLYRREATAVGLSVVFPAAGVVMWALDLGPMPQVNLTPTLFLGHVVLDGYAFVGTSIFDSNPTTRRAAEQTAIDDLGMPIMVLDTEKRIVDLNRTAQRLFGSDEPTALRQSITELSEADFDSLGPGDVVTLPFEGRQHEYMLACSPLTDPRGRTVGKTVVFQDITQERQQKQRLEVLNRVIRHNLRNEMTVIQGYAGTIAATPESPAVTEWAETITNSSNRLIDIGEKARDFERIINTDTTSTEIGLQELLNEIRTDLESSAPETTVELSAEPSELGTIRTDPSLFVLVITTLVESTLSHNESPTPAVEISVQRATAEGEAIEISIQDNGAGIPESELAPLRNGSESPLEHGSGVSLWIVYWGVRVLGGELAFESQSTGTTATVSLPQQRVSEQPPDESESREPAL
ncbi:histidine kinase N-terminal 7TM domain-containing protein [Halohasta litorea]|uniref:histidine kinase n=1 Tax=Halohasta litorea TaxID=869891 RepID=A0ABD6D396_9EURY|nr:histidine kinase N-terminal 7TM domain-containing protein [Halohasta litorea]